MNRDKKRGQDVRAPFSRRQEQVKLKQQEPDHKIRSAYVSFMLLLAAGGMELCWLYAVAAFFMTITNSAPFPYIQAVGAFWLAAVLTLMTRGLGWRVFQTLLLHLAGLAVAVLRILYVFFVHGTAPFFDKVWLLGVFGNPKKPMETFILFVVIIFSAAFYFAGVALIRRPNVYLSITRRLDLGIGIFILLLLVNAGIGPSNPAAMFFLFPFFFFSMLALALARNRGEGKKEYLPGQRWVGLVLTFSIAVLIFAVGAILLFLPYLTVAAETGLTLLKWVFTPFFYSFLLPILKFMFGARPVRSIPETGDFSDDSSVLMPDSVPESFWGEIFAKLLGLGISGLVGIVLLIAAGWGIRCLFRWLLSRTPKSREHRDFWKQVVLWFAAVRRCRERLLSFIRKIAAYSAPEGSEAVRMYKRLLTWGRSCGFPCLLFETPQEYGLRLGSYFPAVKAEIELIISIFNREIYGGIPMDERQSASLRRARQKFSNPLLWFLRFMPKGPIN